MKSEFEQLVVAKNYISVLEKENEALKAEVGNQFKMRKKLEAALKAEKEVKEKMTPKEKIQIKMDLYVRQQKESLESCSNKLRDCRKLTEQLQTELIKTKLGLTNGK
ncbi:hypothetical protein [Roseivirga echinicomitans]|uniref:Uncharacterized protein n=1 Tax=Roseivirga echinicomitans TaxID=296218 RepID=A0A150X9G1_9BACT|nr:hypothetical protein [Roseivirga echinicomitans]KYG75358.1 hypothetical protein AWN68_07355 [Roseivirga echinicomitans]